MGWLGWTEEQTLDTSMPAIVMAYEGRREMLNALFGGGEQGEEAKAEPEPDPEYPPKTEVAEKLKHAFRWLASKQPLPQKKGASDA